MTALAGSFEGEEGIILISGTGSVLYGLSAEKIYRIGGWGRVIGDEGSGYWIGKRALNVITREFDEKKFSKSLSKLACNLEKEFGIDKSNVNSVIFKKEFPIQKLAPVVIRSAEEGCKLGSAIVEEAVDGLLWHVRTFLKISKRKKPINMALIGSVVENDNILSRKLRREINSLEIVNVLKRRNSPSFGAVLIGAGKFKEREII
jgi:N-acetylglucosamine kinase-like BadF-type ATPase